MTEDEAMSDWIKVEDRLPEGGNVLVAYRNGHDKWRIVKAFYAYRFTIESSYDGMYEPLDEYDEKTDTYYLCAGWYEVIDNWDDLGSCFINNGVVTHWQPLPPPPGE